MSKAIVLCPETHHFIKWYRRKVQSNLDSLAREGKSLRTFGFGVTEDQVNRHYKLFKGRWQPGQVMAKLEECGIPCVDRKVPPDPQAGLTIAVKPKDEKRLSHGKRDDGPTLSNDGGDLRAGT